MKIVAAFCYRYEPDWMIEQLRENLRWVDQVVSWNTRHHPEPWVPRAERLNMMQEKGLQAGADWMLHLDVDERLEVHAEYVIRKAVKNNELAKNQGFQLRMFELWDSPTTYRVDRPWGQRWRNRLYHLQSVLNNPKKINRRKLDARIYHLGTIEPQNRDTRRDIHTSYNVWDNRARGDSQEDRFAYLNDDTGLKVREIEFWRRYSPEYRTYIRPRV